MWGQQGEGPLNILLKNFSISFYQKRLQKRPHLPAQVLQTWEQNSSAVCLSHRHGGHRKGSPGEGRRGCPKMFVYRTILAGGGMVRSGFCFWGT